MPYQADRNNIFNRTQRLALGMPENVPENVPDTL